MRWTTRDPILFDGGENLYEYVKGNPVRFVDPDGLARRKGRTPPDKWPSPPPNVVGKNPKWNPEGYWEKGKGGTADVVWDPKGHGQPHWDEDTPGGGNRKKKRRWNKAGELLPFNGYCEQEQLDDGRVEEDWLFEIVTGIASGGISPTSIPRLVPKIVPRIPRLVPAW